MLMTLFAVAVAVAVAGIVATILMHANPSAPERTQPVSVSRYLSDDDAVAAAELERASRSLSRLLETVEAVKAQHERVLMLNEHVSPGRTQRVAASLSPRLPAASTAALAVHRSVP
jgi:hypothetical protein